jgi:dihydroorotase
MTLEWNEKNKAMKLTLTQPDDWHLHLRDGAVLPEIVRHTSRQFARALVMPNLKPPITNVALALAYRQRIVDASRLSGRAQFEPLMTLYLTDNTPSDEIDRAIEAGLVGVKLYPAGATTNSDAGVSNLSKCDETLARMASLGLPLLVHGEVTETSIDLFDREAVFIETVLKPLRIRHPRLKIVFEHITTQQAVDFVTHADTEHLGALAATITAHHLLYNRNAMFHGGIRPHYYCLPVLKRESHRLALLQAATSGSPRFFLGTDSAPHLQHLKENACGCAGCFTAPQALELYAQAFDSVGKLQQLEGFAAFHGADFYGLPRNTTQVSIEKIPQIVPTHYSAGSENFVPFNAGETLQWTFLG